MTFGERVSTLRREKEWTQKELARKIGIDQTYMSRIEADKFDPGLKLMTSIAKAFRLTPSELIRDVQQSRHSH